MESGPAVLAGTAFALFGAGLLLWTSVRLRLGEPVADGVDQVRAAVLACLSGTVLLVTGAWVILGS